MSSSNSPGKSEKKLAELQRKALLQEKKIERLKRQKEATDKQNQEILEAAKKLQLDQLGPKISNV